MPDDVNLLDDLARFLERLGCQVKKGADSLEISIPFIPEEKTERVLNVFLKNWRDGTAFISQDRAGSRGTL